MSEPARPAGKRPRAGAARRGPSREQLAAAAGTFVPDVVGPGVRILFSGINPSLYSGAVGQHFARPGNRFWKTLHLAGLTSRELAPDEVDDLVASGIGITNLVARATARADELTREELVAGAAALEEKVIQLAPRAVAILGLGAFRTGFGRPAVLGRQPEGLGGAALYVLPNPSGLQAYYQLPELARRFGELVPFLAAAMG